MINSSSFSSLGLPQKLVVRLTELNYSQPYPIQAKAIPPIIEKRDVLGIAKTGSGKTASYILPILANLQHATPTKNRHVNVLVLVPTRELAGQVNDVVRLFSSVLTTRVKSLPVFGGVSINPQMIALQGVNILIATPGRLIELVESKAVHLSNVETLVLDEADKMLNLGFKDEMNKIFSLLPKKRQNLLFSATLSEDLNDVKQVLLDNPVVIKIKDESEEIEQINQVVYFVNEEKKGPLLRHLIKVNNLSQILIFAASTYKADNIANKLRKNDINAAAIHSKKSQTTRTETLRKFKEGKINVLVATDLLARGIDIEFLPCVINYDLPRSPKDYIHRIGRTGRADSSGDAITFVNSDEEHHFKVIQKKSAQYIEVLELEGFTD
ncbi:DEAD/DEAH box helicase [Vicingus serpentipes]|uniref:DEAD/DEAH box helicase n=1 Tax=Vicingus serpentipes TaxID=1926625 RepID=A0A5C6RWL6_9FLAO|nr:DEAD/DEAH box helicase [Vicingus serpentipes]TXB66728.1 DEAD/DEAH box helicase [Vicingus serpentipes]